MTLSQDTQLGLFDAVLEAYAESGLRPLANPDLYDAIEARCALGKDAWAPSKVGQAQHSVLKRKLRWYQQTLRHLGLLEHAGRRGQWQLTAKGKRKLSPAEPGKVLLGFSTDLGLALWANGEDAFTGFGEAITLCLTSLPYPLATPRAYGNPDQQSYVDWVCRLLEPVIAQLSTDGSLVVNVGNDIFVPGVPARSLYRERLVIALCDRFGLSKMDELIWENPTRPPGPMQWSSRTRQQLNATYEPLYWFARDPAQVKADNRRVLVPHTQDHAKLIAAGGEQRTTSYGDGSHRLRPGKSYANPTAGRIPRNVLTMCHRCTDKAELSRLATAAGLPVHGATMPLRLARFIIEFLTEKGDLVADPCAGWFRTAKAAEVTGRRWIASEKMGEYVLGAGLGFQNATSFVQHGCAAPA